MKRMNRTRDSLTLKSREDVPQATDVNADKFHQGLKEPRPWRQLPWEATVPCFHLRPDMPDSERLYVDLLYRASKKYANWDPEVAVEVGDWGKITTGRTGLAFWRHDRGTFLKEGNIYKDGKAKKHGIPPPTDFGLEATDGVTWIASTNVQECDVSAAEEGTLLYGLPSSRIYCGLTFSQSDTCFRGMQG